MSISWVKIKSHPIYFFYYIQIDPDMSLEEAKKKFRRMSILVHPDKNRDNVDKAQIAFDAVKRAWDLLGNSFYF